MKTAEEAILFDFLNDDPSSAYERLRELLPGELSALLTAVRRLDRGICLVLAEKENTP